MTDNSIRWVENTSFTAKMTFTAEDYLNVQNISDISRSTLTKQTKNDNKNVPTQTKEFITIKEFIAITKLRLTKEQGRILEENYQELGKPYNLSEKNTD